MIDFYYYMEKSFSCSIAKRMLMRNAMFRNNHTLSVFTV